MYHFTCGESNHNKMFHNFIFAIVGGCKVIANNDIIINLAYLFFRANSSEVYLELRRKSVMELFYKKTLPQMFCWVLHTPFSFKSK